MISSIKRHITLSFALAAVIIFATSTFAFADNEKITNENFKHSKIGVVTGSVQEKTAQKNFPEAEFYHYQTMADVGLAISNGKIDCGMSNVFMAAPICKQYGNLTLCDERFYEGDTGYGFPKGSKLTLEFNEFLANYKDTDDYKRIYDKWVNGDNNENINFDDDSFSGKNGTLQVYTSAVIEPYEYYKDNEIVGFDIEVFRKFCAARGYKYSLTDVNFDSIVMSIASGKADAAVCALVITPERAQSIDFSNPVLTVESALIYKDDSLHKQSNFFSYIKDSFEKTFMREDRWKMIIDGLLFTIVITILAGILATVLGFVIALLRLRNHQILNKILEWYIKIFQGIPVLVILMIFYYIIFKSTPINSLFIAALVFGLDEATYISEAIKSGIESVDPGQTEAALSLGFNKRQTFYKFVLPQAAINFLPTYRGNIISMLKGTSIVGYIAIQDLTKIGDIIRSRTYDAFFPLITIAAIYFLISWIINKLLKMLENKIKN